MADLWMFQDQGQNNYEVDVDPYGGLSQYQNLNPNDAVKYRIGGPADPTQEAAVQPSYNPNYNFYGDWTGTNPEFTPPAPTPVPEDNSWYDPITDAGSTVAGWLSGTTGGSGTAGFENFYVDPSTGQLISTASGGNVMEAASQAGSNISGWSSDLDKALGAQGGGNRGTNVEDPLAYEEASVRPQYPNVMAEQSAAGGTAATIADGTNMKAGAEVISTIVNAVQDPNPQNGIERMIGLLAQYPDDEAAREALLLNIGNLYTAMQTSNPFGYTADKFDQEAVLDRASQEMIARGGMTQNQALTQQSLDRQTQEMIARGGMSQSEAAWQRNLDEQYRQGQLSNEEAAIEANRYGSEAAAYGQIEAARKAAGGVKAAATSAANAARNVATTQATSANFAAALQANTARYANDSQFFTSMANVAAQERMATASDTNAQEIADIQADAAEAVASTNGIAAVDVAQINAGGAERVAIQNNWSAQQVADIQKQMNVAVAEMTNHTETFVATTMADAQRYAAEQQKAAQQSVASTQAEAAKAVASTQAGAAKDVAGTQAGATTTSATTMADAQEAVATTNKEAALGVATQSGLNESAVANIMATVQENIATANNTTAEVVATINATGPAEAARLTGLSQEAIANIQADSSASIAAQTGLNEAAVATIMANAQTAAATTAANPFGLSSQQFLDMQGTQARGGLSVEERLGEISAANEPERLAALLGALAPGVQGSLQGFGMTAPPTVPTISNLRNTTAERQQYIEGLFGSFGVSPSALVNLIQSVSPGSPFGASTFA